MATVESPNCRDLLDIEAALKANEPLVAELGADKVDELVDWLG